MSDLMTGLAALDEAADRYDDAACYYSGDVPEVFANDALAYKLARTGKRYRFNFAKTPVNAVADRLEIAAVSVPGDEPATALLQRDVWDANQLTLEAPDATRKACMYGDGYLTVWGGDQDATVDVWFNSPATMRVIYDPENPRRKAYAVKRWKQNDGRLRATLYYADRIERYITRVGTPGSDLADWDEYTDAAGDVWPIPNPHGEVPVFHLRTASPYGVPVHKDAYGPQDALNKLMVTMMATTDYAGFPLRYALTEPDAKIDGDAAVDPVWDDDTEAGETDRGKINLPVGPGQVWLASGLKGVGQLEPADPKHFLDPAAFVIRAMAQTTTTPLHYFDPSGDVPSGESLRTADAPLVKRTRDLQMRFGAAYSEALAFALKVLGRPGLKVDVRWAPATSSDDQDAWTTARLKVDAGVPVRQVLLEAGYTAEQVDEWIATNGEDNLRQRVGVLVELGKAVQTLGAGISLGAVSAESVQAAVNAILEPATTGEPAAT